jgi:hypothetical protein
MTQIPFYVQFEIKEFLTLYSSTAGMFKLPIASPLTALVASSPLNCAGDTNCSHRTNLSVGASKVLNLARLQDWRLDDASGSETNRFKWQAAQNV